MRLVSKAAFLTLLQRKVDGVFGTPYLHTSFICSKSLELTTSILTLRKFSVQTSFTFYNYSMEDFLDEAVGRGISYHDTQANKREVCEAIGFLKGKFAILYNTPPK